MKRLVVGLCVLLFLVLGSAIAADEDNRPKVGEAKPTWKDLPGVDDKNHSLEDLKAKDVVVVVAMNNSCPVAQQYWERLEAFAKRHAGEKGQVILVAICVSRAANDSLERMKEVAKAKGITFAYLSDTSQKVGKDLGATNFSQAFVLGKNRVLAYRGAWDNNVNPARVTTRYVEDAVEALLAGKDPPTKETRAKG